MFGTCPFPDEYAHVVNGSSPTSVKTFLFGTLAIPFTPFCQCLSDETVKEVGPFYPELYNFEFLEIHAHSVVVIAKLA